MKADALPVPDTPNLVVINRQPGRILTFTCSFNPELKI
jgi:hypothetical protein